MSKTITFPYVEKYDTIIKENKKWIVMYIKNGIGKICSLEEPPKLDGALVDLKEPYYKTKNVYNEKQ